MTWLARGRGSLSLGTHDAPTSCMPSKLIDITPLLRYAQFFLWEVRGWPTTRAKDNAPAEEQQPDPEKRQDVLVERTVWAWEHMMHKQAIHYRRLHRMEYCLRWVWDASSASLVLIHSYHRPHVLVAPIHVYIGVSRGPQALWPSCRWHFFTASFITGGCMWQLNVQGVPFEEVGETSSCKCLYGSQTVPALPLVWELCRMGCLPKVAFRSNDMASFRESSVEGGSWIVREVELFKRKFARLGRDLQPCSLAQFRDCHSCYDERSIDQKKLWPSCRWRQNIYHYNGHATNICPW